MRARWLAVSTMTLAALMSACSTAPDTATPSGSSPSGTATRDERAPSTSEPPAPCPTDAPVHGPASPPSTDGRGGLAAQPQPEHNQAPLAALDAATGRERWRVCPGPWAFSDVTVIDQIVLVRGRAFQFAGNGSLPCGQPTDPVLLALSLENGGVVWASDDARAWAYYNDPPRPNVDDDVVIVVDHDTVRALAPATGATRWTVPGVLAIEQDHEVATAVRGGEPPQFVDRRTGAPLADPATTTTTTTAASTRRSGMQTTMTAAGGATVEVTDGRATYADADGTPRWTVEAPPFTTEVRGVSDDVVFLAGAVRVGNCP